MLLAAAGDIRMLVRGGVFGAKRIVRHLWRMCFGFSSPQGPSSWDSNKSSPLGYADQACSLSPPCCRSYC